MHDITTSNCQPKKNSSRTEKILPDFSVVDRELPGARASSPKTFNRRRRRETVLPDPVFDQFSPWDRDPGTLPPRHWLYARHYLTGTLSMTIAPPGLGKSTLAIVEAVAMATGRNLLGESSVGRPLNVLYWNGEETRAEIERRVHAACRHFGINPRELGCRLRIASGLDTPIMLATGSGSNVEIDRHVIERLRRRFREWAIDVLILDPFVAVHRVNENDNSTMDSIARALATLAYETITAIELIHHTRKQGAGESAAADARGASALVAAARSVRVLNSLSETDAARAGIKDRGRGRYFKVDQGKSNYAPAGGTSWFEIVPVELPNGDNVATVEAWQQRDALDGIDDNQRARVCAVAQDGEYRRDPRSDQWIGRAIGAVTGLDPETDKARLKAIARTWLADGTLREIEGKDKTRHTRLYVKPGASVRIFGTDAELTQTDAPAEAG